jgi:hypothetical protein
MNGKHEDCCLLKCDAMQSGRKVPLFQRNLLPASSGWRLQIPPKCWYLSTITWCLFARDGTGDLSFTVSQFQSCPHLKTYFNNLVSITCVEFPPFKIILNLMIKSAVSIVTGYGLDGCEVRIRVLVQARVFSLPCCPDWL